MVSDPDPPPAHPPRVRFDTLFTEPRHYRGDLRLFRKAVRRGWLDAEPQSVRDQLVRRYVEAVRQRCERMPEPEPGKHPRGWVRVVLREAWAVIELVAANQGGRK